MVHNHYEIYRLIIIIYVGAIDKLYSLYEPIMMLVVLTCCVSLTSQVKK